MQYTPPFREPRSAPTARDRRNERACGASQRERRSRRRQRAARSPLARLDDFRAGAAPNAVKQLRFVKMFLTPTAIASKSSARRPIRAVRIRAPHGSARQSPPESATRRPVRAVRIRAPQGSARQSPPESVARPSPSCAHPDQIQERAGPRPPLAPGGSDLKVTV